MPRTFVIGDPQAAFATIHAVLDRHAAIHGQGLAGDVVLVSIGDHFDYDHDDPVTAGREGVRTLHWLADHHGEQVRLLLGNHDAVRVMELIGFDDTRFADARALARSIVETKQRDGAAAADQRARGELWPHYPELPTAGIAARDYASYSVAQRDLVIELLLAGRFHLALAGELADGRSVLLTHAGVTERELALLGLSDERDPQRIAAALDAFLDAAVDRCRADWRRGVMTPLSLAPLHITGTTGQEGGGLLYHRPTNPDHRDGAKAWELDLARPRRFDPRTLPRGLTQIAGHTGHHKCREELGDAWTSDAARARLRGGIRTLRVVGDRVSYDLGVLAAEPAAADLILIDGEMRRLPAAEVDLLSLARVR
jgi:hypothetical protein